MCNRNSLLCQEVDIAAKVCYKIKNYFGSQRCCALWQIYDDKYLDDRSNSPNIVMIRYTYMDTLLLRHISEPNRKWTQFQCIVYGRESCQYGTKDPVDVIIIVSIFIVALLVIYVVVTLFLSNSCCLLLPSSFVVLLVSIISQCLCS